MTGMVAGVEFLGLLLAERLRRERGARATAVGPRRSFWMDDRFGSFIHRAWISLELDSQLRPSSPPPLRLLLDTSLSHYLEDNTE